MEIALQYNDDSRFVARASRQLHITAWDRVGCCMARELPNLRTTWQRLGDLGLQVFKIVIMDYRTAAE